jgi:phosphate transport system permease protein
VKQGNRDLYGNDFVWIDESAIVKTDYPDHVVVLERREWGNFYGFIAAVRDGAQVVARGDEAGWEALQARLPGALALTDDIRRIEKNEIGSINAAQERVRLRLRGLELRGVREGGEVDGLRQELARLQSVYDARIKDLDALKARETGHVLLAAAGAQERICRSLRSYARCAPTPWGWRRVSAPTAASCGSSWPAIRASRTPRAASSPRSSAR